MKLNRIVELFFSPNGTTGRVTKTISEELAAKLDLPLERYSFTRPLEREREFCFTNHDMVIIGSPTYAGKLPNKILPDFQKKLSGNGALAVVAVTFGNRSYDNALAELCAVLGMNGFHVIAAGAFVAQHAFTEELAYGRPAWSDLFEIKTFAKNILKKLNNFTDVPEVVQVPGDAAAAYYVPKGADGESVQFLKVKPKTDLKKCNNCGACVRGCPMGAIDPRNVANVPGICIKCHACVNKCTKRAKYFDDPALLSHLTMLKQNFTQPKENEVFL